MCVRLCIYKTDCLCAFWNACCYKSISRLSHFFGQLRCYMGFGHQALSLACFSITVFCVEINASVPAHLVGSLCTLFLQLRLQECGAFKAFWYYILRVTLGTLRVWWTFFWIFVLLFAIIIYILQALSGTHISQKIKNKNTFFVALP